HGPDWLGSQAWIYPSLVIIGLWGVGDMMLMTLATMQGVPTELYEAARVDGAGPLAQFRHITLPMITPVIFYNLVLTTIGIVQYFLAVCIEGAKWRPRQCNLVLWDASVQRGVFLRQHGLWGDDGLDVVFICAGGDDSFVFDSEILGLLCRRRGLKDDRTNSNVA
ncbi:MAG: carbohydrate ABC transporter permease, partial [Anaerolineae bacterium]